jgi:hypothetical protein
MLASTTPATVEVYCQHAVLLVVIEVATRANVATVPPSGDADVAAPSSESAVVNGHGPRGHGSRGRGAMTRNVSLVPPAAVDVAPPAAVDVAPPAAVDVVVARSRGRGHARSVIRGGSCNPSYWEVGI